MSTKYIIGSLVATTVLAFSLDSWISDGKLFGGTTPKTVSDKGWWEETDKKFQAWPQFSLCYWRHITKVSEMETSSPSQLPDNVDMKPSFRKLSNDAAQRKYRRHSPDRGSDSSPSSGSPNRDRGHSPNFHKGEAKKMSDDRHRRKEDGRDAERDASRYRGGKDNDYYRRKDKQFYGSSNDYHRHNDYKGNRYKHADEDERSYYRSATRSVQESRGGMRADHVRHESDHDRHRENRRFMDKYSRESPDDVGYRRRDKDRETIDPERDRHRDRVRDDKRDHWRSSGDHKNSRPSSYEDLKGHPRELSSGRISGLHHSKEAYGICRKESGERKEEKRKMGDSERDPYKERPNREKEEHLQASNKNIYKSREQDVKTESQDKNVDANEYLDSSGKKMKLFHPEKAVPAENADEKSLFSSKPVQDGGSKVTAGLDNSSAGVTDTAHDLNAAKVAAMKAAELVNRNLVGGGCLTTDQKKKLLWGNKKNTPTEEFQTGNRWDATMFPDRERQEKFNKLMGVKGDVNPEHKPKETDASNRLDAEKQNQLQMDLEKQYTAGLRRRDGRTVGLGFSSAAPVAASSALCEWEWRELHAGWRSDMLRE
ncbi:hypothetical protein H6P81_007831 [Aristolochia fimbriata]|uniref:Small acidic protein-like domain-containing protein n=1 Tax=Aristolochia fimbriata TaxID=158543 RepID=A0AAV7F1H2_ARIFI|nr:hypothetical protein H6P81_007831 [Aristolochia fimbriata]